MEGNIQFDATQPGLPGSNKNKYTGLWISGLFIVAIVLISYGVKYRTEYKILHEKDKDSSKNAA